MRARTRPAGLPTLLRCSRLAPPRFPPQTFIIPALAYNIHYQLKRDAAAHRQASTKPPTANPWLARLGGWNAVFAFNW